MSPISAVCRRSVPASALAVAASGSCAREAFGLRGRQGGGSALVFPDAVLHIVADTLDDRLNHRVGLLRACANRVRQRERKHDQEQPKPAQGGCHGMTACFLERSHFHPDRKHALHPSKLAADWSPPSVGRFEGSAPAEPPQGNATLDQWLLTGRQFLWFPWGATGTALRQAKYRSTRRAEGRRPPDRQRSRLHVLHRVSERSAQSDAQSTPRRSGSRCPTCRSRPQDTHWRPARPLRDRSAPPPAP